MMALNRRAFLTLASTAGVTSLVRPGWLRSAARAHSQLQPPKVVRIAHLSSRQEPRGERMASAVMGAQLGAEEGGVTAAQVGTKVELIIEELATPEHALPAVEKLISRYDLSMLIGALDDTTTSTLSEFTQQRRVLFLNAASRRGDLRGDRCHRYTFHVEPDITMYVHALGRWLFKHQLQRWYSVVSGDSRGGEVYFRASQLLQHQGGKDLGHIISGPGQRDYTPVLEHLADVDADVIFLVLMGDDLRQFLVQYREAGLARFVAGAPLDMMTVWETGPEHFTGTWVTSWYHQLDRHGAAEFNQRFERRFDRPPEAFAWANWAAVKLLVEGVLESASVDSLALLHYLEGSLSFDGRKGIPMSFRRWDHQLRQPLYIVQARDTRPANNRDLLEVIGEIPATATQGVPAAEVLDSIGEAESQTNCRMEAL